MSTVYDQPWFRIAAAIVAAFVTGVSIANVIYYYRISKNKGVSSGEGYAMLWISGIILTAVVLLFIVSLFRAAPKKVTKRFTDYATNVNQSYDA
jgi:hypothetical protein